MATLTDAAGRVWQIVLDDHTVRRIDKLVGNLHEIVSEEIPGCAWIMGPRLAALLRGDQSLFLLQRCLTPQILRSGLTISQFHAGLDGGVSVRFRLAFLQATAAKWPSPHTVAMLEITLREISKFTGAPETFSRN